MNKNIILILSLIFLSSISCKNDNGEQDDPEQNYSMDLIWERDGFSQPECAFTFPGHPWIYVSNPNEPDVGYISRMNKNGEVNEYRWVEGIQLPTGMDEYNGHLYVVSTDRVYQIDINTAEIVKTYMLQGPGNINDIVIRPDNGKMYISEVAGGGIYTNEGDNIVPFITDNEFIKLPNAMMMGTDHFYVGNMANSFDALTSGTLEGSAVYKVSFDGSSIEKVSAEARGSWDGLDFFADGMVASSPATGEVWYFYGDRQSLVGEFTLEQQISDFGIDADAGIIYAPLLGVNKIAAYQLTKQ